MLTHIPSTILNEDMTDFTPLSFLGNIYHDNALACAVADGLVDPTTLVMFNYFCYFLFITFYYFGKFYSCHLIFQKLLIHVYTHDWVLILMLILIRIQTLLKKVVLKVMKNLNQVSFQYFPNFFIIV